MLALAMESVGNRWFSRGFRPYSRFLVQCYSEAKYTRPGCGTNAWAKPGVNLVCGDCGETMEPE
jgi:hypothetical protein